MRKISGTAFILVCGLLAPAGAAFAADAAAPADAATPAVPADAPVAEQEPEYTFGTVKSLTGDQLVINEYDYDTGEEKEATYTVDPSVELHNVAAVTEIAVGDEVDIDYLIKGDKKTAIVLSVAKPIEGEGTAAE